MKRPPEYFEGAEPELIYIAKRLRDATRLEGILDEAGIDYGVEADEYRGGVIFPRLRTGAFFYVLPEHREAAVAILRAAGFEVAVTQIAPGGLQ